MEISVILRLTTFLVLLAMAILDYRTKHVPIGFPFLPIITGVVWASTLKEQGYYIDLWWLSILTAIVIYNILLVKQKTFKIADAISISASTLTLFTAEMIAFAVLCYLPLVGLAVYAKVKEKKNFEIPYLPIIAGAYLLAVALL